MRKQGKEKGVTAIPSPNTTDNNSNPTRRDLPIPRALSPRSEFNREEWWGILQALYPQYNQRAGLTGAAPIPQNLQVEIENEELLQEILNELNVNQDDIATVLHDQEPPLSEEDIFMEATFKNIVSRTPEFF